MPARVAALAIAHSNIALAKYWGKLDRERNLSDVPSLSLTLGALTTRTRVAFDPSLTRDVLILNGAEAGPEPARRASELLARVRAAAKLDAFARVESTNDFPTASGLASSASGFAALAMAALRSAGLAWSAAEVSALARQASVSAARSIYGGFVTLEAGALAAEPLDVHASTEGLIMLVAATDTREKSVGSTNGMLHTQATSPYYSAWRASAPSVYREVREGLCSGDFQKVGEAMEHSALAMHASMLAARPALIYWTPATVAALSCVRELRQSGAFAYFTIDAGPHVKVLTTRVEAERVRTALASVPGVRHVIESGVGGPARCPEEP